MEKLEDRCGGYVVVAAAGQLRASLSAASVSPSSLDARLRLQGAQKLPSSPLNCSYLVENGVHHSVQRHGYHGVCLRFILHLLHCHPPGRSSSCRNGEEEPAAHARSRMHSPQSRSRTLRKPHKLQSDKGLKKK